MALTNPVSEERMPAAAAFVMSDDCKQPSRCGAASVNKRLPVIPGVNHNLTQSIQVTS